ncbi:DoxX family protein [Aeromicrobium marinum DSM 15272]|uniref:DoxX family protein n=1 Tax=Aeromicrobium marinum DSM 15272 TaxID=585531 RepID=E2SDA9_9ACTN|nr:DoxX family protein [Aeromicrobium marinum]EFQ82486.1 DoxX family protein [Aeromicrobium marinum DSM 15272]
MDHDLAALVLRVVLGATFVLHGWNHGFGAGGLAGTASWFEGIGLRWPRFQAAVSTYLELAAGIALVVGLFTPAAAAACIGVMATAFFTVHRSNGFFIFKEGYEYVLVIAASLTALAMVGPGRYSLDDAFGLELAGWEYGVGAFAVGVAGAVGMLAVCWRPSRTADTGSEG